MFILAQAEKEMCIANRASWLAKILGTWAVPAFPRIGGESGWPVRCCTRGSRYSLPVRWIGIMRGKGQHAAMGGVRVPIHHTPPPNGNRSYRQDVGEGLSDAQALAAEGFGVALSAPGSSHRLDLCPYRTEMCLSRRTNGPNEPPTGHQRLVPEVFQKNEPGRGCLVPTAPRSCADADGRTHSRDAAVLLRDCISLWMVSLA